MEIELNQSIPHSSQPTDGSNRESQFPSPLQSKTTQSVPPSVFERSVSASVSRNDGRWPQRALRRFPAGCLGPASPLAVQLPPSESIFCETIALSIDRNGVPCPSSFNTIAGWGRLDLALAPFPKIPTAGRGGESERRQGPWPPPPVGFSSRGDVSSFSLWIRKQLHTVCRPPIGHGL